jgi:hypothetical protein
MEFTQWVSLIATGVTALATGALWYVTKTLTAETRRMADNQSRAQVVADVLPSPWATNHAEIVVQNTGTVSAFDIRVVFTPEIKLDLERSFPFGTISLLRPEQSLLSYYTDFGDIIDKQLNVSVSWAVEPGGRERHSLEYTLNIPEMLGRGELGGDPAVKAAESLKKIADKLDRIAGNGELTVQVHTHQDRQRTAQQRREWIEARRKAANGGAEE